jgi:hydroxyacylglutathione hydrolase
MRIWTTSSGYKIFQVLSGRSNVFLIKNDRRCLLVDTGPEFMWGTLQKRLNRLLISQIDLLILTHSHFDHAANASRIKEKYNAKVIIHKTESKFLTTGDNILPTGTNAFSKLLIRTLARKFISIARYPPCNNDFSFDESFELEEYGFNGYLIHTPGHTEGSTSIIIDNEVALVGDTMFGIFWWTVFPPFASDQFLLLNSWGKLLNTKCRIFIPSHGSVNRRTLVQKDYSKLLPKNERSKYIAI